MQHPFSIRLCNWTLAPSILQRFLAFMHMHGNNAHLQHPLLTSTLEYHLLVGVTLHRCNATLRQLRGEVLAYT